jgi:hypothetical protein
MEVQHLSRQVSDKADQSWVERRIDPKVSKDDVEKVLPHLLSSVPACMQPAAAVVVQ